MANFRILFQLASLWTMEKNKRSVRIESLNPAFSWIWNNICNLVNIYIPAVESQEGLTSTEKTPLFDIILRNYILMLFSFSISVFQTESWEQDSPPNFCLPYRTVQSISVSLTLSSSSRFQIYLRRTWYVWIWQNYIKYVRKNILRKVYEQVNEQEVWKNGTDQGLRELCTKLLIWYWISKAGSWST